MTENNNEEYSFWADRQTDPANSCTVNQEIEESLQPPAAVGAMFVSGEKIIQDSTKKEPGKAVKTLKKLASLVVYAVIFGAVAAGTFIGFHELYYLLNPADRPSYESSGANLQSINQGKTPIIASTSTASFASVATCDVSSIVENAMPSLVSISCTFRSSTSFFGYLYEGSKEGSGSGIIVGENDKELLIATNNHVVDSALTTKITFPDGTVLDASVRGTDEAADLAIVSVALSDIPQETKSLLRHAKLGDSDSMKVGQMVIAIGNALGYGQTTTVGYLSAKEREISVKDSATGKTTNLTALQVTAAINPGNSGGALLNTDGEVIGINTAKLSSTSVEGIGYAIPISNAIDILNELMNREILAEEEKGYLGVNLSQTEITSDISSLYGFPAGVYIAGVIPGGAAEQYGIYAGDIITAINESPVTTRAQLQEKVASYRSGTTISITLYRMENGVYTEHELSVVLGSRAEINK